MVKVSMTIIPNDEILDVPIFYEEDQETLHSTLIEHFTLKYFGIKLDSHDLLKKGFIIIRTVDDLIICEIPEKITPKQFQELKLLEPFISSYKEFAAGIITNEIIDLSDKPDDYNKTVIDYFYEQIDAICVGERSVKK